MSFSIGDLVDRVKSIGSKPAAGPSNAATNATQKPEDWFKQHTEGMYKIVAQDWYKAKPYGFKMTNRDGSSAVMFLPINPSNLTITTSFATNLIPTLYGTIEEHSEVRYYDISIEGTTGIAPRFVNPSVNSGDKNPGDAYKETKRSGRSTVKATDSFSAGGFFAKTLGAINQALNKSSDLLSGAEPKNGIASENSGYVAFHNLYRFLLKYKKDAAGAGVDKPRTKHPLTFFNYKDNNQYDVVVKSFTMRRSADNPMLYHYSIQLRGYNLKSNEGAEISEDLTQRLKDLGLNGVDSSSLLGDIKKTSSSVKGIIGAAVGGINILGR